MVLLPDNADEFAAEADNHVHSTPLNTPPPSPNVIEIVAVDQNRRRNPVTHHPPLGVAKTPSRKRPAPQNPASSKKSKVCFKKNKNSRPILLQDEAIVEAGPALRDPSAPGPSGVTSRPSQPFIGEAGPSHEAGQRSTPNTSDEDTVDILSGDEPSQMQNSGKAKESGRLGKGKAKNKGKARNPNIQLEREEEPQRTDAPKDPKTLKIIKQYKKGKISELKMRKMGYIKNCEISIRTTYVGDIPQIYIICNTPYGKMSVAQYRQFFCGEGRDWEEEDTEDNK